MRAFASKILPARLKAPLVRALHPGQIDRETIAHKYLSGNGIEIGALHTPLKTPKETRVKYLDRLPVAELRAQYPELAEYNLIEPDIIADGELLNGVVDASQDFVIANHFIEHCQNPLLALSNMFRVLKDNGILYLAVPDKRYTFDIDRPVTPLNHLLRDFNEGPEWSRRQHFEEWTRLVDKVSEVEVDKHVSALMEKDYSIHFHVWTQKDLLELVSALRENLNLSFDVELFLKQEGECVFVLRKTIYRKDAETTAAKPQPSGVGVSTTSR
jgi:SAM-dependent methyltransferase